MWHLQLLPSSFWVRWKKSKSVHALNYATMLQNIPLYFKNLMASIPAAMLPKIGEKHKELYRSYRQASHLGRLAAMSFWGTTPILRSDAAWKFIINLIFKHSVYQMWFYKVFLSPCTNILYTLFLGCPVMVLFPAINKSVYLLNIQISYFIRTLYNFHSVFVAL